MVVDRKDQPGKACTSTQSSPRRDFRGFHAFPIQTISQKSPETLTAPGNDGTYKAIEANPVRVRLATRCTLDLKGIVIRLLFGVLRTEIVDSMRMSALDSRVAADCRCGAECWVRGMRMQAPRVGIGISRIQESWSLPGEFGREKERKHLGRLPA